MQKQLPTILIVDDTEENLFFLEAIISKLEVNLIKSYSGPDALKKTSGIELALAILDVRMPEMTGYELAELLNVEPGRDKVPVIFLTAFHFDEMELLKGYKSGAVDYIFKPVNQHILLSKINVFIDLYNQKLTIAHNARLLKDYADKLTIANDALKSSEEKYRSFFELNADLMAISDMNGNFLDINFSWSKVLGYSREELISRPYLEFVHPEDTESTIRIITEKLKRGDTVLSFENRYICKDGEIVWLEWTSQPQVNKNQTFAIVRNITERKKTEAELKSSLEQLHLLSQHVEKVRENERVAISRELHDGLGQALTAVKIDLGLIKQKVSNPEALVRINKVSSLVSETIKTVQRLTSQLRPQILEDLGLEAAIEWHTKEFAERFGVKISLDLDLDSELYISPDASLTVFRIMQESLTNIVRHSKATHIEIKLSRTIDSIHFRVSDNGIGITVNEINSKQSFGLIGMKERAASIDGTIEIYNLEGNGTEILLVFPIKK